MLNEAKDLALEGAQTQILRCLRNDNSPSVALIIWPRRKQ
jgi:hypothetical protein